ncbi:MAG: SRPBCC family protein [Burkholderiales bacterium]|nr:SRPBCC family protein [Burkholderiales bacterium]
MSKIVKSIVINVPVSAAYNQWTQFEQYPTFMTGIKEVRQLDDRHLLWRVEIFGRTEEWETEITEQVADQRIVWRYTQGARNAGRVTFHPLSSAKTVVTLQMGYDPEGLLEKFGDKLGLIEKRVENDLEEFKRFIESRNDPTGAWRGELPKTDASPGQA